MPAADFKPKSPWENKFRTPSIADLRGTYLKPNQPLFDHTRDGLAALDDAREELVWLGVPWRWSLVYRTASDPSPLAYLVPQPLRPRIAMPVGVDTVLRTPTKKLSRFVREGLLHCPQVAGVRWASWEITLPTQADEVIAFIQLSRAAQYAAT